MALRSIYLMLWILGSSLFYSPLFGQSETLEPVVFLQQSEFEIEGIKLNNSSQCSDFQLFVSKTSSVEILGEWYYDKGEANFHPSQPLDATNTYFIRYRDKHDQSKWLSLTSSADLKAPTPEVVNIYPTADQLPENLLRFYLEFSEPMLENEFQRFVEILDENGNKVAAPFLGSKSEYWDRDHYKITLFFHPGRIKTGLKANELHGRPLKAGHSYTLLVKPGWKSREGIPSETSFSKKFSITEERRSKIDPSNWQVNLPKLNSREQLIIDFGQSLDHINALTFIVLQDQYGQEIEGEITLRESESIWEFTPTLPWRENALTIICDKTLEDVSGNNLIGAFDTEKLAQITAANKEKTHRIPLNLK
ncbi:MAG: hypothetical protein AAFX87_28995 [Bacteroidota bacterium]